MHRFTLPYRVRDAQAAQDSTTFKTKAGLRQPKKDIMTICEYNHTERFELEDGGHIDGLTVRYHRSDRQYDPNGDPRKVVWICHAFTAKSDPQDRWPDLVGPGQIFRRMCQHAWLTLRDNFPGIRKARHRPPILL